MEISGNIVDVLNRKLFAGRVTVESGRIASIERSGNYMDPSLALRMTGDYILPGFVDAHVHIESSMLVPSEFARLAVTHGTVAAVSDPHEIANVLGVKGIRYMIENGKKAPFKFYFGASSCVPATNFETAGAEIGLGEIRELFEKDGLKYLSEMMNYPGVLNRDPLVMEKINIAHSLNRPVDGHAPGLRGDDAKRYIEAGIATDHECFTLQEALDKLKYGMKILIREGSAAKNYEALHTLIRDYPNMVMYCSDDKHPNDLVTGQIDQIVSRSVAKGYELFDVLGAACVNPVKHYSLDVGLLQVGDPADFIVVNNLTDFKVKQTYMNGQLVAENGETLIKRVEAEIVNNFNTSRKQPKDFEIEVEKDSTPLLRVIEALDGQLITRELHEPGKLWNARLVSNTANDVLKLAVVGRYGSSKPAIAFIRNFGLKKGAIASCVAHDSHNIISVGVSDEDICNAVNGIIDNSGGISVASGGDVEVLPLPVAGIMTNDDGYKVAEQYTKLDAKAKELGTTLHAPFMTLSFMALLVIPQLKLSDKGLFDGKKFEFVDLFVE
ncbi:MAG: adenine deaminase [Chlorobi bacterium]|nr:adenine deaminase [Chlorobiota bacterium]MCI0716295.1 adenine deaminase [Chlorobiota bacterium]